jgi:hypothetical protein
VNALAFGRSTEENCRTLQTVDKKCLEWARRHGASFAPEKYILVHFQGKDKAQPLLPPHFANV